MRRLTLSLLLAGCAAAPSPGIDPARRGPHPVGSRTLMLTDTARSRTLPVEVWYPADDSAKAAAETGESIANMVPNAADRAAYEGWLAAAPAACGTRTVHSARNAPPAKGPWPLVLISHCLNCTRFAYTSVAEHLASRGIAVAAPDHLGNTVFDDMAGHSLGLSEQALNLRLGDLEFVLNTLLDANAAEVDSSLHGKFDADRIGMMGHSFGSVTTGFFAKQEPRVKAMAGLAAPIAGTLSGLTMDDIPKPVFLFIAVEDNSVPAAIGNDLIEQNYLESVGPAWKINVADAGHFSVSDVDGVIPHYDAGCGAGKRMTDGTDFTYAPFADTIDITRTWVAAHFAAQLQNDAAAKAFLANPPARAGVTASHR